MGLTKAAGRGPVAVDTSLFIYLIEEHPRFLPAVRSLFSRADQGAIEIVTSALTLLEVLVVPLRQHNEQLALRYDALLTHSRGVRIVDLSREVMRMAARLRAQHNTLRTPDAIQVAAAITSGCTSFVTNDRTLPKISQMRVLQLSDYLA